MEPGKRFLNKKVQIFPLLLYCPSLSQNPKICIMMLLMIYEVYNSIIEQSDIMEKQSKDDNDLQFIYPVPFEDFVNFRRKQSQAIISGFNIKELNKLRKLKKLLQSTQEKICNRIKLFKKVSIDLQRKKEKENMLHERFQSLKKEPQLHIVRNRQAGTANYLKSTKSSACGIRIRNTNLDFEKPEYPKQKSQLIMEQKIDHAKEIKIWKQQNKLLVQQRRIKEMREKVQSASLIRSNRSKAKEIKIQCEQQRMEQARRAKEQIFKEEIEKYDELQSNLTKLQREEREALIMWKRAMESL